MSVSKEISDTIIVTGFGPFGGHVINASWESVKLLPSMNIEEEFDVKLVIQELPVKYKYVTENVPDLWRTHNPMLVVHVGVSSIAKALTLELQAHKSGYCLKDVEGELPPRNECCEGQADIIQPVFDVQHVCQQVDKAKIDIPVCVSSNAGRFLCEFIYYTSLNIDNLRTIFIHVPELNGPFCAADVANGIKTVLGILIKELRSHHQDRHTINDVCSVKIA